MRTRSPVAVFTGQVIRSGLFVGLATLDVVSQVAALPGPDEKITAVAQFVAAGGPAANAAVTFAALGGHAVLLTALGTGGPAELIRGDLQRYGVHVVDVAPDAHGIASVSAASVLPDGRRSVVGADAAGVVLDERSTQHAVAEQLPDADAVLLDGHHPYLAVSAACAARSADVRVVVDAGRWKPVFTELAPLADDVVCSADLRTPGSSSSADTADVLQELGIRTVVVTAGAATIRWWQAGQQGSVEPPQVPAVDTLGAGDTFHGAYLRHLDLPLPARLQAAAQVAALRCTVAGPRAWLGLLTPGHGPGPRPAVA